MQKPWDNLALVQILDREIAHGRAARARTRHHERQQHDALLIQRALMPVTLPVTARFEVAGAWRRLLLYTDGVTEARNRHLSAAGLHAAVMEEVTQFAALGFQDDGTLLAVAIR